MAISHLNASPMAGGVIAVGVVKYKHGNVLVRACYAERFVLGSGGGGVTASWRAWA